MYYCGANVPTFYPQDDGDGRLKSSYRNGFRVTQCKHIEHLVDCDIRAGVQAVRTNAEWRRWDEADRWRWDEEKRQRWAEQIMFSAHRRARQRQRFMELMDRQRSALHPRFPFALLVVTVCYNSSSVAKSGMQMHLVSCGHVYSSIIDWNLVLTEG